MKVKIGNTIYNSNDTPIMVILNENEKRQIRSMPQNAKKYCQYPDKISEEKIRKWMNEE